MLGKIAGGLIGKKLAERFEGRDAGLAGAVIGAAVPVLISRAARLGPLGWAALAVGGYAAGRIYDRARARHPVAPSVVAA